MSEQREEWVHAIMRELGILGEKLDGVNRRLDITNGRIAKVEGVAHENSNKILLLTEKDKTEQEGKKRKQSYLDTAIKFLIEKATGVLILLLSLGLVYSFARSHPFGISFVPPETFDQIEQLTK